MREGYVGEGVREREGHGGITNVGVCVCVDMCGDVGECVGCLGVYVWICGECVG